MSGRDHPNVVLGRGLSPLLLMTPFDVTHGMIIVPFCRQGLAAGEGQAAVAGEEIREVQMLPNAGGIMLATGDCRLLFFNAEVRNPQYMRHICSSSTSILGLNI